MHTKASARLNLYCAVEAERQKWEACEARTVSQLDRTMEQIVILQKTQKDTAYVPLREGVVTKQQPRMITSEIEWSLRLASSSSPVISHTSLTQLTSTIPPVIGHAPMTQITLTNSNIPESPATFDLKSPTEGSTITALNLLPSKDSILLYTSYL